MRKYRLQKKNNSTHVRDSVKQTCSTSSMQGVLGSEDGMILIVGLLLLLVATVVGITALSTSTTNIMIAGNQRLSDINFTCADSGVSVSVPIVDNTAYNRAVSSTYTSLVSNAADFASEIGGSSPMDTDAAETSPDITFGMGTGASAATSLVDIDYLYYAPTAGCALEFASGYEGVGKGASGCGEVYYRIASVCQGQASSEASVCSMYRYVIR
jgi:Tfp pilus assembly protein PilX